MNVYVIERYTGEGGHWRFSANWSCFGVAMTPEGALQREKAQSWVEDYFNHTGEWYNDTQYTRWFDKTDKRQVAALWGESGVWACINQRLR